MVLLVKNLPANTDPEDLREVFSKHGALGRVLMPPSGVTAIVEYLDPTEAKLGFRNLAYTKVIICFIPALYIYSKTCLYNEGPGMGNLASF